MYGPGKVGRKHNTKASASLPCWYRDTIKLWLNWCRLVFDEGDDGCFFFGLKSNLEVELQLARCMVKVFSTSFWSSGEVMWPKNLLSSASRNGWSKLGIDGMSLIDAKQQRAQDASLYGTKHLDTVSHWCTIFTLHGAKIATYAIRSNCIYKHAHVYAYL